MIRLLLPLFLLLSSLLLADEPHFDAPEKESYSHQILNMLFALTFVVGLIFTAAWLLKRFTSGKIRFGNHSHKIQIIERRPLAQKSCLYLIEVEGKRLLISDSPGGVHHIAELPEKAEKERLADMIERRLEKQPHE